MVQCFVYQTERGLQYLEVKKYHRSRSSLHYHADKKKTQSNAENLLIIYYFQLFVSSSEHIFKRFCSLIKILAAGSLLLQYGIYNWDVTVDGLISYHIATSYLRNMAYWWSITFLNIYDTKCIVASLMPIITKKTT